MNFSKPILVSGVERRLRQFYLWLDRWPKWLMIVIGAISGVLLGCAFLVPQSGGWVVLWGGVLALLAWLGLQTDPVFKPEQRRVADNKPSLVREGDVTLAVLPGGEFMMGSPDSDPDADDNEKPQHRVKVSPFYMMTTPVTAGLYQKTMGLEEDIDKAVPKTEVSWIDAVEFCNCLSQQAGYKPCYFRFLGRYWCNWRADGYRLPTEAEWEYACRARSSTRYCFGDDPEKLENYAWSIENFSGAVHPVAQKRPNGWGLYDMHGNVWEWCWDKFGSYTSGLARNPHGSQNLLDRIGRRGRFLRGGAFNRPSKELRSACRDSYRPDYWYESALGFRCVRTPY